MRDRLLWTAIYFFTLKGYQKTSLADIASFCDIQKPTILYYFKSKEALALESISTIRHFCKTNLFIHLQDIKIDPYLRFHKFLKEIKKFYIKNFLGFFIINLMFEFSSSIDEMNKAVLHYFSDWNKELVRYFSEFYSLEESKLLATDILIHLQGAALLQRTYRKSYYIKKVCDHFIKLLPVGLKV